MEFLFGVFFVVFLLPPLDILFRFVEIKIREDATWLFKQESLFSPKTYRNIFAINV